MFYSVHPNVYPMIDILLNMQFETCSKMKSMHINNKRNNAMCKENEVKGKMKVLRNKKYQEFNMYKVYRLSFYLYYIK